MDLFKNLIDVPSENGKIHEVFEFTNDIHKMIGCNKKDCDISIFLKPLEEVLFNPEKSYDYHRNFFISQCMKHPKVFGCMFQLKSKNDYVKAVIKGLKVISEAQEKVHFENIVNQL